MVQRLTPHCQLLALAAELSHQWPMEHAALGFRVHTGWAAAVVVGGAAKPPKVLDRFRVTLADPAAAAVYHAARELELGAAEKLVAAAIHTARRQAVEAVRAAIARARAAKFELTTSGIALGNARLPSSLAAVLRSHPLVHAAEGELFRRALIEASEACHLRVTGISGRGLEEAVAPKLGRCAADVRRQIAEAGRSVGKPWTQDQKQAMLLAWLALTTTKRS